MKLISKRVLAGALIIGSALAADGFSLIGPLKPWQVERIGYDRDGDIGGPMELAEGYRLTTPTLTYAFDQSFARYFGSNGMAAVDRAMDILNDLFTNGVSTITDDGTDLFFRDGRRVPMNTRFFNQEYQTLGMLDVKSHALSRMMEELGLHQPERWVWALRGRATFTDPDFTNYAVIKINYDPITYQPSSAVNGTVYTYTIFETANPDIADAFEFPLDPLNPDSFTAVAGFNALYGDFFFGLTHDDVGGLKWLYNTNNMAVETLLPTVTGGQAAIGGSTGGSTGGSPWTPFLGLTNLFFIGTNFFFNTNVFGTNNLIQTGLRPGVNAMRFEKVAFDSIIGQNFVTVTNLYLDTSISNAQPVIQPVQRAIPTPDFLFLVEDLGVDADAFPFFSGRTGTGGWVNNDALNGNSGQGGPGVIPPPIQITFTSLFPVFLHQNPGFIDEFNRFPFFGISIWATFDEAVDEPIFYPAYEDITLDFLRDEVLRLADP